MSVMLTTNVLTATTSEVERLFSRGRLILPHVRNRLSAQSMRAIICVGAWSAHGFIQAEDSRPIGLLEDVDNATDDYLMEEGWDRIQDDTAE